MEGGYPRIDTSTGGSCVFIFRFRKSSKIFYDPGFMRKELNSMFQLLSKIFQFWNKIFQLFCKIFYDPSMIRLSYYAVTASDSHSSLGSFKVTINAADLEAIFGSFPTFSKIDLTVEAIKIRKVMQAVYWPDGDLFFFRAGSYKKVILGLFEEEKFGLEIYDVKAEDHLNADDKKKARKHVQNAIDVYVHHRRLRGENSFVSLVQFYHEHFGKQ